VITPHHGLAVSMGQIAISVSLEYDAYCAGALATK
jgi:hypothetical protein